MRTIVDKQYCHLFRIRKILKELWSVKTNCYRMLYIKPNFLNLHVYFICKINETLNEILNSTYTCQMVVFTWISTSETWPKDLSTYLKSLLYSQANGITLLPRLTLEKYILQNFPMIISLFYPQNTFQATSIVRYCRSVAWKVY